MCRNIKTLYNFDPPANDEEIRAAATQFVRKLTGFDKPSNTNQDAVQRAIDEVSMVTQQLFAELTTAAQPRNREVEAAKAKARSVQRFGQRP